MTEKSADGSLISALRTFTKEVGQKTGQLIESLYDRERTDLEKEKIARMIDRLTDLVVTGINEILAEASPKDSGFIKLDTRNPERLKDDKIDKSA